MTLFAIGSVRFEVAPVNVTGFDRETSGRYAEKPVMGRRPPLEFMGEGPETITLPVKLFPYTFGGEGAIGALDGMRSSGNPYYLMRGDGAPLGWFVVDRVRQSDTWLSSTGVGRVIEVTLGLKRSDPPDASGLYSIISGLFS
jgi:phage protein U